MQVHISIPDFSQSGFLGGIKDISIFLIFFSHWILGEGYHNLTCVNNEIIYIFDVLFSLHFPNMFLREFSWYINR